MVNINSKSKTLFLYIFLKPSPSLSPYVLLLKSLDPQCGYPIYEACLSASLSVWQVVCQKSRAALRILPIFWHNLQRPILPVLVISLQQLHVWNIFVPGCLLVSRPSILRLFSVTGKTESYVRRVLMSWNFIRGHFVRKECSLAAYNGKSFQWTLK